MSLPDLTQVRAALFDLDGTLVHSLPDLAEACRNMLLELGRAPCDEDEVGRYVGKGMSVLVERCLAREGVRAEAALQQQAEQSFRRHYHESNGRHARLYPGVREGLQALRAHGIALACVTNKPQAFTEVLLQRMQIAEFFPVVVGGDALPNKKPAPDMLLHACAQCGQTPASALMVGDSANDALAARAAGIPVILTTYGYTEGVAVDSIDCDGLVSDITQILPAMFADESRHLPNRPDSSHRD